MAHTIELSVDPYNDSTVDDFTLKLKDGFHFSVYVSKSKFFCSLTCMDVITLKTPQM